jgi:FkbM family methyltransferase
MQAYFRKTLDLNPHLPIRLHPIGLGAEDDTLELSIPEGNAGSASFWNIRSGADSIAVPVKRMDDAAETAEIDGVDFIKIDVAVAQDAPAALRKSLRIEGL